MTIPRAVVKRLQDQVPGLTVVSAGGADPFMAEGGLCGLSFAFRFRRGRARLRVGGDLEVAPLYAASRGYGHHLACTLSGEAFGHVFADLVPRLRRAERYWQFEGIAVRDSGWYRRGGRCLYGAFAHTAEEALAKIQAYPSYKRLLGYCPPPAAWAEEVAARQINPRTFTVDDRIWPTPEPHFRVLRGEG